MSPTVWPQGPDAEGSPIGWTLANPGIVSIPLGFLGVLPEAPLLSKEETKAVRGSHELLCPLGDRARCGGRSRVRAAAQDEGARREREKMGAPS